jgi:D-glycero-D-manno-heptose 1,7-bisphosphate phosphatase
LTSLMRPAVFLDRDGTLTVERGYISDPDALELIGGAGEAVRMLNEAGVLAVLVSNQSGVARGYMSESDMAAVHRRLEELLLAEGARLDAAYYCPNHPEGKILRYARDWSCRKPGTGMIDLAVRDLEIDTSGSYIVGDHSTDIELANRTGIRGIMVETGHGENEIDEAGGRGIVVGARRRGQRGRRPRR